jgi:hypothetical protein
MGRRKIPQSEHKVKISITIDKEINAYLEQMVYNKSIFIQDLIKTEIKNSKK